MKIFGKTLSEYFHFQRVIMTLIILVGLGRLVLSLAGLPVTSVRWLSLTALAVIGILYCAIQVPRTGFGSYRHLLPLFVMQAGVANLIIAGGIVLSIVTGEPNIYSVPEYSGIVVGRPWLHAGAHVLDGLIVGPLMGFLIGSAVMFLFKKLSPSQVAGVAKMS
jgi:hypothetical protein